MNFFSNLFAGSTSRRLRKARTETASKYRPLGEIAHAIVEASVNSRDAVKEIIEASSEKERKEREIFIFYEFIWFYTHVTMRHAFSRLTEPQIEVVQAFLGPLLSSVSVDTYFAHWPGHLKEKIVSDFYDDLNNAELQYAQCTQGVSGEDGFKALMMALGSKISAIATNSEKDIAILLPVAEVATREWGAMQLDSLIGKFKAVVPAEEAFGALALFNSIPFTEIFKRESATSDRSSGNASGEVFE